jgi:BMFP domain-containing protein YqiC
MNDEAKLKELQEKARRLSDDAATLADEIHKTIEKALKDQNVKGA